MGRVCIVCKWRTGYAPKRMFHVFPSDKKEKKAWLKTIGKTKEPVSKSATVCSHHFRKSRYTRHENGKLSLKPGSIPTLHLDEPEVSLKSTGDSAKPSKRLFKCGLCIRKFLYTSALRSHLKHVHKVTTNFLNQMKPIQTLEEDTEEEIMPITKVMKTNVAGKALKPVKANFQCPVPDCEEKFTHYTNAIQHIQRKHINKDGKKVSAKPQKPIKPIPIGPRCSCDAILRLNEKHVCENTEPEKYLCMGCEQIFSNMHLYEVHLEGIHGDDCESYFMPDNVEFTELKSVIEANSEMNYVFLNNQSPKLMYHCSYQESGSGTNPTHLCPSTITVKALPNGFHVRYYKNHSKHECPKVSLPQKFKKYCISPFLKDTDDIVLQEDEDDQDLYLRFKRVMNNIVIDAAKINITTLNLLLGKALELTTILNSYDEDDDYTSMKKLTDNQITEALGVKPVDTKRKAVSMFRSMQDAKRLRREVRFHDETDISVETVENIVEPVHKKVETVQKKVETVQKRVEPVQKRVEPVQKKIETVRKKVELVPKKAEPVQKKVELVQKKVEPVQKKVETIQKKVEPVQKKVETIQKKVEPIQKTVDTVEKTAITVQKSSEPKEVISKPVKTVLDDIPKDITPIRPVRFHQSSPSFNDSYKNFVDQNFKNIDSPKATKKKEVVKTKIGQFKPSISPKKDMPKITKVWTMKPDIEYEVKERENDCNILILKI